MAGLIENQMPFPVQQGAEQDTGPYGLRPDGTKKSTGFFGELKRPDGDISTELSIGIDFGKGEMEIPMLVPNLSKTEINHLLSGGEPTPSIIDKAVAHARMRLDNGLSPFAGPDEVADVPKD